VAPLKALIAMLPDYNLTLDDIHAVEVIGGATRVPSIKAARPGRYRSLRHPPHCRPSFVVAV